MARQQRTSRRRRRTGPEHEGDQPGGAYLEQLGLLETGSGLPHGPTAILLAFLGALIVYPIVRIIRAIRR